MYLLIKFTLLQTHYVVVDGTVVPPDVVVGAVEVVAG